MLRLFRNLDLLALLPALLGFMLAALGITGAGAQTVPAAPMPAPLKKDFSAEIRPEDFSGALDVRLHPEEGKLKPPAELLLKDPQGRRIGLDPRLGITYQEIPHAYYEFEGIDDAVSGAPGPESGVIDIRNPVNGRYTLEVIGREPGYYSIEITGFNKNLETSKILLKKARITPGVSRAFSFSYSHEAGKRSVTPEEPAELRQQNK